MATSICGHESDQAKKTILCKHYQLRGGLECNFVKDPPEEVQTECSVCLCVLREPYLVDCCGYSFCRSCIETVKLEHKPCPLCAVQFTTCIPDKRLQRTLNDFQVYCSHMGDGCDWVGSLGNLTQHLNAEPLSEGERLSGCQLTSIECKYCFDHIRRQDIVKHETMICPQRPHSCEYCDIFTSTFDNVTLNHIPVCPDRPVSCPNGCELSLKAKLLEDHLEKDCPFEVVECPFNYAGCDEKVTRQSMPEHITQSVALHMSLQATSHQQELKKLYRRINELEMKLEKAEKSHEAEVAELKMTNKVLLDRIQDSKSKVATVGRDLKIAQDQRLKGHLNTLRGEIKKAQAETKLEVSKEHQASLREEIKKVQMETSEQMKSNFEYLHCHAELVPFTFTMPNFEQKKLLNTPWQSPSFYSHGYKMCLSANANGYGDGMNSHVSVFVHMMKGDYDDQLKWPFRGDITIQILNQSGSEEHDTLILDVTDDDSFGKRVIKGYYRSAGLGYPKFLPHTRLCPHYLKNDCLHLCVKEVKLKCT